MAINIDFGALRTPDFGGALQQGLEHGRMQGIQNALTKDPNNPNAINALAAFDPRAAALYQEMAQRRQEQQDQAARRDLYSKAVNAQTGEIDYDKLIPALATGGHGDLIPDALKQKAETLKVQGEAAKQKREAVTDTRKLLAHGYQTAMGNPDDATLQSVRQSMIGMGADPNALDASLAPILALPVDQRGKAIFTVLSADPDTREALKFTMPEPKEVNVGGSIKFIDMNSNSPTFKQVLSEHQVTMSQYQRAQLAQGQQQLAISAGHLALDRQKEGREARAAVAEGPGGKPPQAFTDAARKLADLKNNLKEYRAAIARGGKVSMSGVNVPGWMGGRFEFAKDENTADLSAKYTSVMMGLKDLYQLGALAGPDVEILERQLTDPTSFAGIRTDNKALLAQLAVTDKMIQKAATNLETTYGRSATAYRNLPEVQPPAKASAKQGGDGVDHNNPWLRGH